MKRYRLLGLALLSVGLTSYGTCLAQGNQPDAFEKLKFLLGTWDCKEYMTPKEPPAAQDLYEESVLTYTMLPGDAIKTIEGHQIIGRHYYLGQTQPGDTGWGSSEFFIFNNPAHRDPGVQTEIYDQKAYSEAFQRLFFVEVEPGDISSGEAKWINGALVVQLKTGFDTTLPLTFKQLADNAIELVTPSVATTLQGMKGSNIGGVRRCTRRA